VLSIAAIYFAVDAGHNYSLNKLKGDLWDAKYF
jgi:hypothetical protein